jgi:Ca2+-binding RTX toxin-like protein
VDALRQCAPAFEKGEYPMMRRLFSSFGRATSQLRKGQLHKGQLPKGLRRGRRSGRRALGGYATAAHAQLSIESLETRIALTTSAPELTGMTDLFLGEGFNQSVPFLATFTQEVDSPHPDAGPQFTPGYSVTINWGDSPVDDTTGDWRVFKKEWTPDGYKYTGRISGNHSYALAGTYLVSVTLDDGINLPVTTSFNVDVYPVVSSVDLTAEVINPSTGDPNEGDLIEVSLSSTLSPTEYKINWGDGTVSGITGSSGFDDHVYADNHTDLFEPTYQSWVAAKNSSGWFFAGVDNLNVLDVAPTLALDGSPTTGIIGQTYTLDLAPSDPGDDQPEEWFVDWEGNGNFEQHFGPLSSLTHVYNTADTYTISVFMLDSDANNAFATWEVMVNESLPTPTADAGGPYSTFDDTPIALNGSGTGGTGMLSYAWDLNENGVFGETGPAATNGDESLGIFNPSGLAGQTITIKLRVTDEANETSESTSTVEIKTAEIVSGSLVVVGNSEQSDNVSVTFSGGNIVVQNGSGAPQTFDPGSITSLQIRTGGGNDIVVIGAGVNVPTTIDGGDGNDLLVGGAGRSVLIGGVGSDFLYGGAGDDVLQGGIGNDQLFGGGGNDALVGGGGVDIIDGGAGRDLVAGGAGSDLLVGGGGDDILIGGTTVHDGDVAALDSIMSVWTGAGTFNARVAALTAAGVGLLRAGNISDDDSIDIITTGAGNDLVFGDTNPFDGAFDLIAMQSAQDRLIAVN